MRHFIWVFTVCQSTSYILNVLMNRQHFQAKNISHFNPQVDDYLKEDISDANRYFAQCYKDGQLRGDNLAITRTPVLSYNKKSYHPIFSIQPMKPAD